MSSEWVTVGPKNRRGKLKGASHASSAHHKQQQPPQQQQQRPANSQPPTSEQVARWCALVAAARDEVAASAFLRHLSAVLSAAEVPSAAALPGWASRMVVWGLGSLDSGLVHIRFQLALAQLLRGLLGGALGEEGAVEAFDPVFTLLDKAVLEECGMRVSLRNPQGRHVAAAPTLFFLPHCDLDLTERLLACNVEAGTLGNVAILGNSFGLYRERQELLGMRPGAGGGGAGDRGGGGGGRERQPGGAASPCRQSGPGRPAWAPPGLQGGGGGPAAAAAPGGDALPCLADLAAAGPPGRLLCELCWCGAVAERGVGECGFPVASAFNDMALHLFAADWWERLARQRLGD